MFEKHQEEIKAHMVEMEWLLGIDGEVIATFRDLTSVIQKCRTFLTNDDMVDHPYSHNAPLTTGQVGNDCIKGVVEVSGFLIPKANLHFQFPKVNKGYQFNSSVSNTNPWTLSQIQTASNFISLAYDEVTNALNQLEDAAQLCLIDEDTESSNNLLGFLSSESPITNAPQLPTKEIIKSTVANCHPGFSFSNDEFPSNDNLLENEKNQKEITSHYYNRQYNLKRARGYVVFILKQINMYMNKAKSQLVKPERMSITELAQSCNFTVFQPKLPECVVVDFHVDYSNLVTTIYILSVPTSLPSYHAKNEKCKIEGREYELEDTIEIESDIPSFGNSLELINLCCELGQGLLDNLERIDLG